MACHTNIAYNSGVMCAVAAMIVVSFRLRIRWTGTLTVCVAVACIGSMTAIASDTIAWHDPASAQARQSSSYHEVMATVTTPVIASDQRTYDCQTDIRLSGITVDGTDVRSTVAVRVYADESYCGQLRRGAVHLLTGVLQQARYGRIPLWLLLEGKQPVAQVRAPPWHLAAIAHVQEAFFTVTEQLSDQGRVLVPGLTMGVLGQDYIGGETGPMPGQQHVCANVGKSVPPVRHHAPHGRIRRPLCTGCGIGGADYACGCCLIGG